MDFLFEKGRQIYLQIREFLEPIKMKHPWISYADLWTLAGVVSIEAMGGPVVDWSPGRLLFQINVNLI
jgi:catalase (peroxidase I)